MRSATVEPANAASSPETDATRRITGGRRHLRGFVALICLIGALLTGAFSYQVARKPGVYLAQVDVLFVPPRSAARPNSLLSGSGGLASVAGAVGKMVDPDATAAHVVSAAVTLADQGVRHGYSVSLPNDGGQWANNFDRALLNVQAVGASFSEVHRTAQRLVADINADLASIQAAAGVAAVNRIHTSMNPSTIQVYYLTGSRARALAATLVLGFALTAAAAILARRRLVSRA